MLKFNISALGENITLSSIKLKKTGNYPYTIVNVSLYWDKSGDTTTSLQSDDVLVGGPAKFDSSGYTALPLNFRENLSHTETFVVVYDIGKLK